MNILVLLLIICFKTYFWRKQQFFFWFTYLATEPFLQVKTNTKPTREKPTAFVKQDVRGLRITRQSWCLPTSLWGSCSLQKKRTFWGKVNSEYLLHSVCHPLKSQNWTSSSQIWQNISPWNTASEGVSVYPGVPWIFLVKLSAVSSLVVRK